MNMHIIPERSGILRLEHHVVGTEERATPIYFNYSAAQTRENLRIRCSMCGRLKSGGSWEEPETQNNEESLQVTVAYSVCGDCHSSI